MKTKDALAIGIRLGRLQRTLDAWEESKHPRANNGQFSHSAGGGPTSQGGGTGGGKVTNSPQKESKNNASQTGRPFENSKTSEEYARINRQIEEKYFGKNGKMRTIKDAEDYFRELDDLSDHILHDSYAATDKTEQQKLISLGQWVDKEKWEASDKIQELRSKGLSRFV